MYIDLRKVLGHIRFWDTLTWDGTEVLAVYKNKIAARTTHAQLSEALIEMVPIVAMKESSTKIVIQAIDKVEATNAFLATHVTICEIAVEEILKAQTAYHLIKLGNDSRTPLQFYDKIRRVVAMKEYQARRENPTDDDYEETADRDRENLV